MLGLLEDFTHCLLRLSYPLGNELWSLDCDEIRLGLISYRLGNQRLTGSRCSEQDYAAGRFNSEVFEHFGLGQRPLDTLLESLLDLIQTTDFVP